MTCEICGARVKGSLCKKHRRMRERMRADKVYDEHERRMREMRSEDADDEEEDDDDD